MRGTEGLVTERVGSRTVTTYELLVEPQREPASAPHGDALVPAKHEIVVSLCPPKHPNPVGFVVQFGIQHLEHEGLAGAVVPRRYSPVLGGERPE